MSPVLSALGLLVFATICSCGHVEQTKSSDLQVKPQNQNPSYCNQGFYLTAPVNITTPNYPYLYDMSNACLWNIVGEKGGNKLKLTFNDFQIGHKTRVDLYDLSDINLRPPAYSWTSVQDSPFSVTINSTEITLVFMTSQYLQNYKYKGLSAEITTW